MARLRSKLTRQSERLVTETQQQSLEARLERNKIPNLASETSHQVAEGHQDTRISMLCGLEIYGEFS